jgi:putative hemolysin
MSVAFRTIPADREVDLQPFSAGPWFEESVLRAPFAALAPLVDRALALPTLSALYRAMPHDGRTFWDRALETLEIGVDAPAEDIARIPGDGPLVVIANHPFGCADGLALMALLSRVRPDARLLGNALLARIPELRRASFFVDVLGGPSTAGRNASPLREALRWVGGGGALAMFPAGAVSHVRAGASMVDSEWSEAVARVAVRARATVVPVYFHGTNSRMFHAVGRIHPRLRTALLIRELLGQRRQTIRAAIGTPVTSEELRRVAGWSARTSLLRARTYAGSDRGSTRVRPGSDQGQTGVRPGADRGEVAPPERPAAMAAEMRALDDGEHLMTSGDCTVCMAPAYKLTHTLREIGRLREIAFRAVGEGSGRDRDIDRFDAHYHHLIVWNHERSEVVGAYRIGMTDDILPRLGADGLYTSTLFQYDGRLLNDLGPALELGRAFVRREYQRDYSPLLLLWKGIGAFVARHPRYRRLFGTVSISADYQSLSQQILAGFLYATSFRPDLAARIHARNPPPFLRAGRAAPACVGSVARTIADVGALVAEIESDGKGVPVLLRQYLKLNAQLLGFNVDPMFGGVLDGLMMVDLLEVEPGLLTRYLGKGGAQAFLEYQRRAC